MYFEIFLSSGSRVVFQDAAAAVRKHKLSHVVTVNLRGTTVYLAQTLFGGFRAVCKPSCSRKGSRLFRSYAKALKRQWQTFAITSHTETDRIRTCGTKSSADFDAGYSP